MPLVDALDKIPLLTRLFVAEWEPYYGPEGPGEAEKDLNECCNRDELPLALVALGDDGAVLGTAALKHESVGSELGLGPWLAALCVPIEHRERGIGSALVEAIESKARDLGFAAVYMSTDTAGTLVRRRGWARLDVEVGSLRGPVAIHRKSLHTRGGRSAGR